MERRNLGILLIVIGAFLFLLNFNLISWDFALLLISIGFIVAYYRFGKILGFLIPGCILLSISAFNLVKDIYSNLNPIYSLFFVGIGFILIFFIHYSKKEQDSAEKYWSIYPGISLIALSLLIGLLQASPAFLKIIIPVILIALGIFYLVKAIR
ncbi:MAG TPA: hypothetical protein PKW23_06040 [Dictyoglomaceae bacterium]|nr:hypothetical protein [Dictyoglomaceae bacterium]HOL39836.1 hypothetical protein [Dictyoglomaceae bacterium]HOP94434.1 hypothetical protein [Dictyoglomaceae bacterium]HPP16314.1 hypothetical protein [Dictyoglomaceae bacterium]HPU43557.1 hypothetical protein [Dictyoglomaceae bacterium]